jgi:phosphotransferase family enzyme
MTVHPEPDAAPPLALGRAGEGASAPRAAGGGAATPAAAGASRAAPYAASGSAGAGAAAHEPAGARGATPGALGGGPVTTVVTADAAARPARPGAAATIASRAISPASPGLLAGLAELAAAAARVPCPPLACPDGTDAPRDGGAAYPVRGEVLAERDDATVVRVAGAVAKAHPPGTEPAELAVRLRVAAHPLMRGVLLAPYAEDGAAGVVAGRAASVWPYGEPVDPLEPGAAPWEAAATLLARLHAVPPDALPGPLPAMRGPAKAAAAMARLDAAPDSAAARTVRRAWRRLPGWARDEATYEGRRALCHGDWHLGQLVRRPAARGQRDRWLLIDIDDLGTGDPAWDLARPAMWFGAGLLAPAVWARFLAAYEAAGGTAVGSGGDPWARLDVPARALAVQGAATALAKAARDDRPLDEAESQLVAVCARIVQLK